MNTPKTIAALLISALLLMACTASGDASQRVATGMLKTQDYIVIMYAGSNGRLYSVHRPDGTLLDEDINMETMVARFPALDYLKDNDNIDWAGLEDGFPLPTPDPDSH